MASRRTCSAETDPGAENDEAETEPDGDPHAKRTLKDWLLAPEARTENLTPPRDAPRMRPLPRFD